MSDHSDSHGPLAGYRLMELCTTLSGPFATMLLADQGMDVVKVESQAGDQGRQVGSHRPGHPTASTMFLNINRNKRSVVLDLKSEDGLRQARAIATTSDVVVQNFRPGVMERLKLGYDDLVGLRNDIILVSISGLGETIGRERRVYDLVVQGLSGFVSIQSNADGVPWHVQNAIIDKVTSLVVAQATTAALLHRERTGKGQHVKINMLDCAIAFLWPDAMPHDTLLGEDVVEGGLPSKIQYVYETKDDYMVFGFVANEEFRDAMQGLERPDLLEDPRFANIAGRYFNAPALNVIVAEVLKQRTTVEWLDRLAGTQAVFAPVNKASTIHLDPVVMANRSLVERWHPVLGAYRQPDHPVSFSQSPASFRHHPPLLGEHTDEILAECGFAGEVER
jgi:crotonobetainyl-CoA:carnitine CoA-transferase CaiB-like acyl-CoA transferase